MSGRRESLAFTAIRWLGAVGAAALLATSASGLVLAEESPAPAPTAVAEPPEPGTLPDGLAPDVTVVVTFTGPPDDGGAPIGKAGVTIVASRDGSVVQELAGVTGDDGVATIPGVARAVDGGSDVVLDIAASFFAVAEDCTAVDGWTASIGGVVSAGEVHVDLVGTATSEEVCSGGGGGVPDGVVFDASLAVTIFDDAAQPLAGAWVTVATALVEDGGVFAFDSAVTGDDGIATFSGLARPEAGGPAVDWVVEASAERLTTVDGCQWFEWWFGSTQVVASAGDSDAAIPTERSASFGECADPPAGSPILHGSVLDADGLPFPVADAWIVEVRGDGAAWSGALDVAGDGSFDVAIHAWGSAEAPAGISIRAAGPATRTEDQGGCEASFGLVGSLELEVGLAGGGEAPTANVRATDGVIGVVCAGDEAATGGDLASPPNTASGDIGRIAAAGSRVSMLVALLGLGAILLLAAAGRGRAN